MKFSQRIGLTTHIKQIQLDDIDTDLRNCLWNAFKLCIMDIISEQEAKNFSIALWATYFKLPLDTKPYNKDNLNKNIRQYFFECKWYEVYDLIEFCLKLNSLNFRYDKPKFSVYCNSILEKEFSGYRIIDDNIAPISNKEEVNEIENSIEITSNYTALNGANIHIKEALVKLSDKKNPDYRNSIKESISAVENVAKAISENNKDSLSGALDKIKGKTKIHSALEKGFKQIYGYTSDSDGIRHSLTEEDNCAFEDAKFMLVSCSAFVNYLIAKAVKYNIKL